MNTLKMARTCYVKMFFLLIIFSGLNCFLISSAIAEKRSEMEVKLSCSVDGVTLDGTTAKADSKEGITASVKQMAWGNDKNGKAQFGYISKAEIVGQGKTVEASFISNSDAHAVIAYSNIVKQGVSTFLLTILYEVDFQALKVRRTTSVFPTGGTVAKEVNCIKR